MEPHNKLSFAFLFAILLLATSLSGCYGTNAQQNHAKQPDTSLRDIPGIAAEDVADAEVLRGKYAPTIDNISYRLKTDHSAANQNAKDDIQEYIVIGMLVCMLTILTIFYILHTRRSKIIARQAATLAAIYDSIPAMVFTKDLEGRYTGVNRKFADEFQMTEADAVGKYTQDLFLLDEETKTEFSEATQITILERTTVKTEGWYTYRDGTRRAKEIIRTPLVQGGEVVGLLGIMWDITEHKLAEEAAQKVHERTRIMLDAIPFGCCLINKNYECIDCNSTAVNTYELRSKKEFISRFKDLVPPHQPDGQDSYALAAQHIDAAFETGESTFDWDAQKLDGTRMPMRNSLVRTVYENGSVVLLYAQDLREYKQLTARIETIINNLTGVLFQMIYDPPNYTYTYVSDGCQELMEYTAEEMQGQPASRFVHPDDLSIIAELVPATIAVNLPFEATLRIVTKKGEAKQVWLRSRAAEHHPDGTPSVIEGYFTDVSSRWKLEAAESEKERLSARIEMMIDNVPGTVFQGWHTLPDKYVYTFVSKGCKRLTGYTASELLGENGLNFSSIIHPDDVHSLEKMSRKIVEGVPYENTFRILTKDGQEKWIWERCRVIETSKDGNSFFVEGYYADITERQQLDVAKQISQEKTANLKYAHRLGYLLTLITTSPTLSAGDLQNAANLIAQIGCHALEVTRIGIWTKKDNADVLESISCHNFVTKEFEIQKDFDLTDRTLYLEHLKTARLVITDNVRTSTLLSSLVDDYSSNLCAMLDAPVRIDGELAGVVCVEQNCSEKYPEEREWTLEEQNFAASLADLMAVAIASSKRREAQDAAERANEAKSSFLAVMSHEIRTPMNSIMGFAELAQDYASEPRIKSYLGKITDNTKWLLHIVNDILDISKIESGKMELEHIPFHLQEVVSRCQSVVLPSAQEKGLELRVYVEQTHGKKLVGDPVRLYQVLMNLLSNALKFTSSGIVRFSALVKESGENQMTVYFEVKDTGVGMTPEQVKKIYEPFIQGDSSTTRNYGGTGLGLTITKNIVGMMGGNLMVESLPDIGSTFSFEIVFETTESTDGVFYDRASLLKHEKPLFEGSVLVCEDNPMNQDLIVEHLERVGFNIEVADNGKIGLEKVQERQQKGERPFDLILMDMFMPVMDGLEAATKISELETGTPIVAMTANVMAGELEKYRKHGMPDCLEKPFTAQELWLILLKYIHPVGSVPIEYQQQQAQSDGVLQQKLCTAFVKSNQTKYAEIAAAISAGDRKLAHRLVHSLKGNAGHIGKTDLYNTAVVIENVLREDVALVSEEMMERLNAELSAVLEGLAPLLDEVTESDVTLDDEQISALLSTLAEMLENINPECVDLVSGLRAIPGTERLVRQIEDYDFESAAATLAELRRQM